MKYNKKRSGQYVPNYVIFYRKYLCGMLRKLNIFGFVYFSITWIYFYF